MINYVKVDKFLMNRSMGAMFAGNKGLGKFLRQEAKFIREPCYQYRLSMVNLVSMGKSQND